MSEIAFTVHGVGITIAERDAGLAAMSGAFTVRDVRVAMRLAGVTYTVGAPSGWRRLDVLERAADRLMQAERKAGRIRTTKDSNRIWERVA